jgi:hypothetical protein
LSFSDTRHGTGLLVIEIKILIISYQCPPTRNDSLSFLIAVSSLVGMDSNFSFTAVITTHEYKTTVLDK